MPDITVSDIFVAYEKYAQHAPTPVYWVVSPLVRDRLARHSLAIRKAWPARRALNRGAHRAYRRAGIRIPRSERTCSSPLGYFRPVGWEITTSD